MNRAGIIAVVAAAAMIAYGDDPEPRSPATSCPPMDRRPHPASHGTNLEAVDVKLRADASADTPDELLPPKLRRAVARIEPLVTLSRPQTEAIGGAAMRRWFRIVLRSGVDVRSFASSLERLDVFEAVEMAPRPTPPP